MGAQDSLWLKAEDHSKPLEREMNSLPASPGDLHDRALKEPLEIGPERCIRSSFSVRYFRAELRVFSFTGQVGKRADNITRQSNVFRSDNPHETLVSCAPHTLSI